MEFNDIEWVEPRAGFCYRPDPVVVTTEYQAERLSLCGIDPKVFGSAVDPSFFIGYAIRTGIRSGISAGGNVNLLQELVQHRQALLDESLEARGEIRSVKQVPRGQVIETDCWIEDLSGERVITANRRSLRPDASKRGARGIGAKPAPVIDDPADLMVGRRYRLEPEKVVAYHEEGNPIHYEMEAANRAGFRAPIIGGGMGVHYFLAELWQHFEPLELDLEIMFRRPIFWDDELEVRYRQDGQGDWTAACVVKEIDGHSKVATEARVRGMRSAAARERPPL